MDSREGLDAKKLDAESCLQCCNRGAESIAYHGVSLAMMAMCDTPLGRRVIQDVLHTLLSYIVNVT